MQEVGGVRGVSRLFIVQETRNHFSFFFFSYLHNTKSGFVYKATPTLLPGTLYSINFSLEKQINYMTQVAEFVPKGNTILVGLGLRRGCVLWKGKLGAELSIEASQEEHIKQFSVALGDF